MKNIIKVASISPSKVYIGNPTKNADYIINILKTLIEGKESSEIPKIAVFPELCLTGYTCGDLFNNQLLIEKSLEALNKLVRFSTTANCPLFTVGLPIRKDNGLYNCAAIIKNGQLLALIPKSYLPNYSIFYDMRNFKSAKNRKDDVYVYNKGCNSFEEIPFTPNVLIKDINSDICIGTEICEDLWVPISPSRYHCLNGANIILNLSASNETIGKTEYRKNLVKMLTATCNCAYIYASAGPDESTTDNVFSGHLIIAENGTIINESTLLKRKEIIFSDLDIDKCMNDRFSNTSYTEKEFENYKTYKTLYVQITDNFVNINTEYNKKIPLYPFVPEDEEEMSKRAKEIITIQATGLAQRLYKINCNKAIIGISGGLDSTLALLVTAKAFEINNYDIKGIIGITMPCFGTTARTKNNSTKLMEEMGITSYEIDIKDACNQHYKDIGHDETLLDITYENVQARERTQILMDMANKHEGIVIGTGDLSELALGWCTYNGDHMSMYGVNSSIPKTLVRFLIENMATRIGYEKPEIANILTDILDTPVSPELLPPNEDGSISQITENSIGSYVTHDFIMYYMLRYNFKPSKIFNMYIEALNQYNKKNFYIDEKEINKNKILKDFNTFYTRFFNQQFKRNCLPDGIKVGSVSLSPRGDWKMPSDADKNLWLDDLKSIKI